MPVFNPNCYLLEKIQKSIIEPLHHASTMKRLRGFDNELFLVVRDEVSLVSGWVIRAFIDASDDAQDIWR